MYKYSLSSSRQKRGVTQCNFTVFFESRVVCSGVIKSGRFEILQRHLPTPPEADMVRELVALGADLSEMPHPRVESLPPPPPIPREERDTKPPPVAIPLVRDRRSKKNALRELSQLGQELQPDDYRKATK